MLDFLQVTCYKMTMQPRIVKTIWEVPQLLRGCLGHFSFYRGLRCPGGEWFATTSLDKSIGPDGYYQTLNRFNSESLNNLSMAARRDDAQIDTEWTMLRCHEIGSWRGRYGQTIRAQDWPAQTSNPVAMPGRVLGASSYESLSAHVANPGQDRTMLSPGAAGKPRNNLQALLKSNLGKTHEAKSGPTRNRV